MESSAPIPPGGKIRVLVIGDKYVRYLTSAAVEVLNETHGVVLTMVGEDRFDRRETAWYLSHDLVITPWRFCLLELIAARCRSTRKPYVILATGGPRKNYLVSGGLCEEVIPDQFFTGLFSFVAEAPELFNHAPDAWRSRGISSPSELLAHMMGQRGVDVGELFRRRVQAREEQGVTDQVEASAIIKFLEYVRRDNHGSQSDWSSLPVREGYRMAMKYYLQRVRKEMGAMNQMVVQPAFPAYHSDSGPKFESCFMIMPFREDLDRVYRDVIKPTVESTGIRIQRADDFFVHGSVMPDVWRRINEADFLIADLTGRNPNVYYELGIAHTVGKRVILLAQDLEDVPFDIRNQRIIRYGSRYDEIPRLQEALRLSIEHLREDHAMGVQPGLEDPFAGAVSFAPKRRPLP